MGKHTPARRRGATVTPSVPAISVLDIVPPGCGLYLVRDAHNAPLFRPGEMAVYDPQDKTVVEGEFYIIHNGRGRWAQDNIWQVFLDHDNDGCRGCIWFRLWNRPRGREECDEWLASGRACTTADGPLKPQYFEEKCAGRIIGLYRAADPQTPALAHSSKGGLRS